jgi:hypothetical protein
MPRAPHAATRVREKRDTAGAREIPGKEIKRERASGGRADGIARAVWQGVFLRFSFGNRRAWRLVPKREENPDLEKPPPFLRG